MTARMLTRPDPRHFSHVRRNWTQPPANDRCVSAYLCMPHVTLEDAMFQRFLATVEGRL